MLSRRNLLLSGVAVVLVAHFVIRWLDAPARPVGPAPGSEEAVTAAAKEIAPSVSTLAYMGYEWQQHIKDLPAEQRAASQARLDGEKAFFARAMTLPQPERDKVIQEHLQELMNDPHVQAVMAEDRFKKLTKLPTETTRKLLKNYVDYKKSVTGK